MLRKQEFVTKKYADNANRNTWSVMNVSRMTLETVKTPRPRFYGVIRPISPIVIC